MQQPIRTIETKDRRVQTHDKDPSITLIPGIIQEQLEHKVRILLWSQDKEAGCPRYSAANGPHSTQHICSGQMLWEEILEIGCNQEDGVNKPGHPGWPHVVWMRDLDEAADDAC